MAIAGLDDTPSNFAVHPDYRQVSTFALGWVFITSLSCIISSVLMQRLFGLIRGRSSGSQDLERSVVSEKLVNAQLDLRHGYSNTALFALPLCFLFASVAQFASLLAFPLNGDATCAFVVAWGGMAAQSGRLVGALIIIFELRKLGIAPWEFWVAIVWLIVGIAFIFLNNAVSVGILTFLPASLVSSILYFSLEVYAIARMMLILSSGAQMRQVIRDNRVVRPLALIFLELLTLVPSAVFTNTIAEFLPFSIGAVAVLLAFSYRSPPPVEPSSPRMSTLSYVTYPSVQNISTYPSARNTRQSDYRSNVTRSVRTSQPASIQPPSPAAAPPARRHPFSASALSDPSLQANEWDPPLTARSTRTIDTVAANSIHNAVVTVGQRARAVSRNEDGPQLAGMIVPSQVAYAERLDQDYAAANSLSTPTPLRPTIQTPPIDRDDDEDENVSELISRLLAFQVPTLGSQDSGEGPSRLLDSRRNTFRTSYRTSFIPETVPSSPDSDAGDTPIPLHDSRSISSSERRRSASVSGTQESGTVDHRRSVSIPGPTAVRWPTFNGEQFRAAGYGRTRSRGSSAAGSGSPPSIHRPPPLPLSSQAPPPLLPAAGPGIRAAMTPRGPSSPADVCTKSSIPIVFVTPFVAYLYQFNSYPYHSDCDTLPLSSMASSELLAQIQAGKRLKKATTNDRSAPIVEAPKGSIGGGGGPPQLGGLFAGGMPKLKPAGQNNNLARPPTIGKPPSVPKREVPTPSAPPPPSRAAPPPAAPAAPAPPSRPAPAPAPPTRAVPPPVRAVPPPAPPCSSPSQSCCTKFAFAYCPDSARKCSGSSEKSPASVAQCQSSRSTCTAFSVSASSKRVSYIFASYPRCSRSPRSEPGRGFTQSKPSSTGPSPATGRAVPAPPPRKSVVNNAGPPAPPARVRALSEVEPVAPKPTPPAPPGRASLAPPPVRQRTVSAGSQPPVNGSNGINGRPAPPRRKIPSPPPNAGPHTFPVSDFPPPRPFQQAVRQYPSGRSRGSDFDLGTL
ncbi:hypothetical protein MVEN_01242000 [Mycena venus]|uniref:WH2 domain-containing protein n=1 Tax=Mycena venus TaxID=2733690 RepID=A0A8H6Y4Z6_9AGAR|nr:hypothetical protein MVEN_01242000 [Mycena venus]